MSAVHSATIVQRLWNCCNVLRDAGVEAALEQFGLIAEQLEG